MKWFLLFALVALIFGLLFFPPARRSFLLKHLERPKWPVPPTSRVMNLWRRAVAALGDAGIHPHAGETPSEFALRAEKFVRETLNVDVDGLHEAAALVERIAYAGRGLGPGDEQRMREIILAFVKKLAQAIPMKQKVAAAWGRPPEVEA